MLLVILWPQEGTMIWIFAVIAVMGFVLVKLRRGRKTRQAAETRKAA